MSDSFRRKRAHVTVLSPDEGKRQGRAVRAAQALGDVEAVRAFLNFPHEALGGRPIDLAVASEAGMVAVQAAIDAECAHRAGEQESRR